MVQAVTIVALILALLRAPTQPPAEEPLGAGVPNIQARLAALNPASPESYFLLAEEVAYEARSEADRRLAQQLYALVVVLEQRPGNAKLWSRSACLGLAALAGNDTERRWLWALTGLVRDSGDRPAAEHAADAQSLTADSPPFELATAVGYVRAGEGRRAEQLLEKPAVARLLDRYDALLNPYGNRGGASELRRRASQWATCPQCRNRRVIRPAGDTTKTYVLCDTCGGNPGPKITDAELLVQLRFESALLTGVQKSWSAQVAMDSGSPLRELDLAEVAAAYRVDPSRVRWSADTGGWAP